MTFDPDVLDSLGDLDYEAPSRSEKSPPLLFDLHCFGPHDARLSVTEDRPRRPRAKFHHLHRSATEEGCYYVREVGRETVADVYTVHPDTPSCTCQGFGFARQCRHVLGLQDLVARGKLWQVPSTESH